jgi:SAM-dependent methyltransferase
MLGIAEGIDPSPRMLEIATGRGVKTYKGYAEDLPFPDSSFDGLLLALVLCFVADSEQALNECYRILRLEGKLLLGIIPADSPWGRAYERKKAEGHAVYTRARFMLSSRITALIENAGFTFKMASSTLFWEPEGVPETEPRIETGIAPGAGFLGLLFKKTDRQSPPCENSEDFG